MLWIVGIIAAIIVWFSVSFMIKEQRQWDAFKVAHNCKVVSQTRGSTSTGFGTTIGSNGQVGVGTIQVFNPGQTGYLCDDGVVYNR